MFRKVSRDGKTLDLSEQKLTYDDISALLVYLEEHPNIKMVNLANCGIDDIAAIRLSSAAYVEKMNLANNRIGDSGAIALAKSETLTHLNLAGNKKLKEETIQELAANLRLTIEFDNPVSSYLYQAAHHHENKAPPPPEKKSSLINFSDFVKGNKLDLTKQNLKNVVEILRLVKFLNENPQITELDVSCNKFGDSGARVLAEAMHIEKLNVARTGLTSVGAEYIVKHHQYKALNLSDNTLNEYFITQLVSNQKNLSELRLVNTDLTDIAMPLIASLPALQYLSIRENKISDAGFNALAINTGLSVIVDAESKANLEAARNRYQEKAREEERIREDLHHKAEIDRAQRAAQYAAQSQAEEAQEEQKRIEKETIRAAQEEAAKARAIEMAQRAAEEVARIQADRQIKEELETKQREEDTRKYIAEMEAKEAVRIKQEKEQEAKQAAAAKQRKAAKKEAEVIKSLEAKYTPHVSGDRLDLSTMITRDDIPNVIAFLKAHPKITVLDVSHSTLTDKEVAALLAVSSLRSINLSGLNLTHEGIKDIYANTHLIEVKISNNPYLIGIETPIERVLEINREYRAQEREEALSLQKLETQKLETQWSEETAKIKELTQLSDAFWGAYKKLEDTRPSEVKIIAEAKQVAEKIQSDLEAAKLKAAKTEREMRLIQQAARDPSEDKKSEQIREAARIAGEQIVQQNINNRRIDSGVVNQDEAKIMLENYMKRIHEQWPVPKQAKRGSAGFNLFSKKNTSKKNTAEDLEHLPLGVRAQVEAYNAAHGRGGKVDYTALLVLVKQIGTIAAQKTAKISSLEASILKLCKPENKHKFRETYMGAVEPSFKKPTL